MPPTNSNRKPVLLAVGGILLFIAVMVAIVLLTAKPTSNETGKDTPDQAAQLYYGPDNVGREQGNTYVGKIVKFKFPGPIKKLDQASNGLTEEARFIAPSGANVRVRTQNLSTGQNLDAFAQTYRSESALKKIKIGAQPFYVASAKQGKYLSLLAIGMVGHQLVFVQVIGQSSRATEQALINKIARTVSISVPDARPAPNR